MIPIKGIEKTSFVDFPPYTASTIFLGGCNFRCPFCHNPDLVVPGRTEVCIPDTQILNFLEARKKWIDGVCITGGEPTLSDEVIQFIEKIKGLGLLVKLDTNGSRPEILRKLLNNVDYIAMDLKNSKDRYNETVQAQPDLTKIDESMKLIMDSKVDYEFRTTLVPGLHTEEDVRRMGEWAHGAKKYAIQGFRSNVRLFDSSMEGKPGFTKEEMAKFKTILEKNIPHVEIRS